MSDADEVRKLYVRWTDYGREGWKPTGFNSLKDAIEHQSYTSGPILITKRVDWEPVERMSEQELLEGLDALTA